MSVLNSSLKKNGKHPPHSVMTDTDSSDDAAKLHKTWMVSFMEQPASNWFRTVPPGFISDGFNTFGLAVDPTHAKSAISQLLGSADEQSSDSFDSDSEEQIERCSETIFGLVHARYIFTFEGLNEMFQKYQNAVFGVCPRWGCEDERLLPVGLTDVPGREKVRTYCPHCKQLYEADPMHENLDGAFFSRSFAHYFLMELKHLRAANAAGMLERQISTDVNGITSESQSIGRTTLKGNDK
jgi:casein kinase II subunit beta